MAPRVSVLIGAFNNAGTLERAASSMLQQTVADLELLIIDDGSRDGTGEVAARIAAGDARARVLAMPENVGISRSLNAGLAASSAPYVAVLDADDWSEPRRLERQLAVLESDASIAVVGCRMREVDECGRELVPRTSFASGDVNGVLMRFNPIPNTAAAFRREPALAAGGYDPRYLWAAEYDLWLRLAERYRIVALDEILATRQMSPRNVAARREREQTAEAILMRLRAMRRRRTAAGATGLIPYAISYVTPLPLKRAIRRRIGQAP
jgi:glycosyltransferase involved in cell wall biosynthesis